METMVNVVNEAQQTGITEQLTALKQQYCSFTAATPEERAVLYRAMSNPTGSLREQINKEIRVCDVYAEDVELVDEDTGEMSKAVRVVLICVDGESYACVSRGVFNALRKLIQVYGHPTWEGGITLIPRLITKAENQILTLDVK